MYRRLAVCIALALTIVAGSRPVPAAPRAGAHAPHHPASAAHGVRSRIKTYAAHFCYGANCYQGAITASPAEVARWADYVEPFGADAPAAKAAGIPVVLKYYNFNRMVVGEFNNPADRGERSDYLPACDGTLANSGTAYYWNHANAKTVDHLIEQVARDRADGGTNGIFWDETLAAVDNYNGGSKPCGVSPAAEAANTRGIFEKLAARGLGNIVVNGIGLSPNNGATDAAQQAMVTAPGVIAATYELCYDGDTDHTTDHRANTTRWESTENSELETQAAGRDFICLARGGNGRANPEDRLYAFASLLLTYDPNHSVMWNHSPSGSNTGIFPENAIVPMHPRVPTPRNVRALERNGAFVREYAACYQAAKPVGPCAIVVNPQTHDIAVPVTGYAHALALHGDDVFSGGSISLRASAPASLEAVSAAVLFR